MILPGSIIIIIVSIFFSAFFSGIEIAFFSSNKLKIEIDSQKGKLSAYIISFFLRNSSMFVTSLLIGNNIALVIFGIQTAAILDPFLQQFISVEVVVMLIQTILSTLIIIFTAEFLPKDIFRVYANTTLTIFAVPAFIMFVLLSPISIVATILSRVFLIFSNIKKEQYKNFLVFGKGDLVHFLTNDSKDSNPALYDKNNFKIFLNALEFSSVKLRECVKPRTELIAASVTDSIENTIPLFVESGYSKILVFSESIDNIIGYIHSSDILQNPASIQEILRETPCVPETMSAKKMLTQFINEKQSLAVVVDEFGGTAGIVTVEDIIEEIFGEIRDEHDLVDLVERKINDSEYIFSGRQEIDYLNEMYNLHISESEEYETLAGFFLHHHEKFPVVNSSITIENLKLSVLKITGTRIELIHVKILQDTH